MKIKLISVRDVKTEMFTTPLCQPTEGAAIRSFQEAVNDKTTQFSKHPEDYSLYHVGNWDDSTGLLETMQPKLLIEANQCREIQTER